jgi:heme/copper-type cytochrome/quinol oxidase subunit 1
VLRRCRSSVAAVGTIDDTCAVRRGLLLGSVIGLLNAGLALLLAWWFGRRPAEFGWYSYTPMPRRYADYLPASSTPGWKIAVVLLASFLIVNTAAAAAVFYFRRSQRAAL